MEIKIILFFLLILSLGFHVPSDAFAVDGDTITEVASIEHDTTYGLYNSLVQVDSDTYALAYASGAKITIVTFTIPSDGTTITEVASIEMPCSICKSWSFLQVDSDTYVLAYGGSNPHRELLTTFTIPSDGSTITKIKTATIYRGFDQNGGSSSMIKVDSDTFAVAYEGGGSSTAGSYIQTFTISSDGTSIVSDDTVEHNLTSLSDHSFSLVQVDSDTIALADQKGISTFTVASDGTITPVRTANYAVIGGSDFLAFSGNSEYSSFVQVNSDTYALAHQFSSDGYIHTYTISSDGTTITAVGSLQHDTRSVKYNSLVQVNSDIFALAYDSGEISTFTISSDGTTITAVANINNHDSTSDYNSLVQIDSDMYALAYAGPDNDGFIITFTINVDSSDDSDDSTKKSSSDCYDCEAPKLIKVEVHVSSSPFDYVWNFDQKTPYPMFGDTITPIIADPGDEVELILELTDNRTLKRISDSGTYTNFLNKPNDMNLFYANNFDEFGKVSTTFYEWHNTGEDLVYDYSNTVQWSEPDITIQESGEFVKDGISENLDGLVGTFTISFKMKFLEPMKTSEVWVQATDRSGNFFKVALPLTLKITGNEPLVFESKVNQKVLSFFDESMLLEVVSDWTGSSQDVSELAVILGIPDEQLLPWVANLAVWVSEDRITLADMIVSIEHLINN
jgi:hypothetical protein